MNSNAMEIVDLKEIGVLRHLSDSELGDIKAVHMYGSDRSPFEGSSALYVTKNDEVYLAGFISLIGKCCMKEEPHCHKSAVMRSKKVNELSGLGVKKIVIGDEFGAALCGVGNELYLWGNIIGLLIPRRLSQVPAGLLRLVLEGHHGGARCPKCLKKLNKSGEYELLLYCTCSGKAVYHNTVSAFPAPTDWTGPIHVVIGYKPTGTAPQIPNLFCTRCGKDTPCEVILVSNFYLLNCSSSPKPHHLIEARPFITPRETALAPSKVKALRLLQIIDIAAGDNFLLLRTSSRLRILGELSGVKYNSHLQTPDNVSIARMACGSSHIAVVSDEGGLYTCGVGDKGQLGYEWTSDMDPIILKKVWLNERVVDVACGKKSTVCRLQNGTYVIYGRFAKIIPCGTGATNLLEPSFLCVPTAVSNAVIQQSLKQLSQLDRQRSSVLTGDHSDTFIHLHCSVHKVDASHKTDFELLKTGSPAVSKNDATTSVHQYLDVAHLYGQHVVSDLTLKLSDGEFPVHRTVLFAASAYFKQLFTDSESPGVLDMSTNNAEAYRGLLRYFYGVPIGQLSASDLFDLYVLALSYKENWISDDVLPKLKNLINSKNVLSLHDKAKTANASELITACKTFMNAPNFKRSLWDSFSQDEDMVVEVLRVSESKKQRWSE